MELKSNYVFWSEDMHEQVHGQIVKIEPIKDQTGHQKKAKNGTPVSRLVLRTEDQGDVFVRILDTQRTFWEPQLGKRGYICHDYTNNYLTFDEDERDEPRPMEPALRSLEELFEYEQDEVETRSMESVIDEVEDYCNKINELLNERISVENEVNGAYLRKVRDANIGTVQVIIDMRMRDVV